MNYICMHDKKEIELFLMRDPFLHIYCIGDLDDFFWPYTNWYGLASNGSLKAIALLCVGMEVPTLIALSDDLEVMKKLLIEIEHLLPVRFYAHLSPGLETTFVVSHDITPHGEHYKMALYDQVMPSRLDCGNANRLGIKDIDAIQTLYEESYPGNWFDPRMLETNQYFGVWEGDHLVSIAGIHVYSPEYKVSALGNITTHPSHRNKGYGKLVTARLCQSLIRKEINVGLNVKADNNAAIKCYNGLGFKTIASFGEFLIQKKHGKKGLK